MPNSPNYLVTLRTLDIVTHYVPPVTGPAWNRIRGFAAEASHRGWAVRFTAPTGTPNDLYFSGEHWQPARNWSLQQIDYWDPSRRFRPGAGHPTPESAAATNPDATRLGLAYRIRNLLELPDHRRLWNRHAIRALRRLDPPPSVLLTTSPYNSTHLVGLHRKRHNRDLCWIADFRDPWDQLWDKHGLGRLQRRYNTALEARILKHADILVYFDDTGIDAAAARHGRWVYDKATAIYPGLSHSAFAQLSQGKADDTTKTGFRVVYAGSLPHNQLPDFLFSELEAFAATLGQRVQIDFYGRTDPKVNATIARARDRELIINTHGMVPRTEALREIAAADLLLVLCGPAREMISSKIFESMAAGVPVIYIGHPESGGARILRQSGLTQSTIPSYDAAGMRLQLERLAAGHNNGDLSAFRCAHFPEEYLQAQQAGKFLNTIEEYL